MENWGFWAWRRRKKNAILHPKKYTAYSSPSFSFRKSTVRIKSVKDVQYFIRQHSTQKFANSVLPHTWLSVDQIVSTIFSDDEIVCIPVMMTIFPWNYRSIDNPPWFVNQISKSEFVLSSLWYGKGNLHKLFFVLFILI